MVLQYYALLLFGLGKCHGRTQFIYTANEEVNLVCDTNKWQISAGSNKIELNCLVKCYNGEPLLLKNTSNIPDFCEGTHPEADPKEPNAKCSIKVRSGFFACVKALKNGFIFPFKPSSNIVDSYIVAIQNPNMTSTSEITATVMVNEGESVPLNCSFSFTEKYKGKPFVVYWIKTTGNNSTCVYSYDFNIMEPISLGHHCEHLLDQPSDQTIDPYKHKIIIRQMELDSAQYLCVVHVQEGNWKVIQNITVSVRKAKTSELETDQMKTGTGNSTATQLASVNDPLIPLYVTLPILLCLLVASVVLFIKRTTITSPEPEVVQLRAQNREVEPEVDCSPYAVGSGEEEIGVGSNWNSSQKFNTDYEELSMSLDPYSIVRIQK